MSASSLVIAVVVAVVVVCARSVRVTSASQTRHRATSPSRRHAASPSRRHTCTPFNVSLLVLSTPLWRVSSFIFFVRCTRTTRLVLLSSLSLRVAARIFAFPSHYSSVSRSAAPSVIVAFLCVLSDLRRIYVALRLCHLMRRSAVALNQTSHYLISRRASRARSYPTRGPYSLASFFMFLSVGPTASFSCSKSPLLLATR